MHGEAWTRPEIDELVLVVESGGDLAALGVRLKRTPEALLAKAGRLELKRVREATDLPKAHTASGGTKRLNTYMNDSRSAAV